MHSSASLNTRSEGRALPVHWLVTTLSEEGDSPSRDPQPEEVARLIDAAELPFPVYQILEARGLEPGQRTAREERIWPEDGRLRLPGAPVSTLRGSVACQLPAASIYMRYTVSLATSK